MKPYPIMKKLFFLLLSSLLLFACEKTAMEHELTFDQSYKAWQSFKIENNDSYRYHVTGSSWTLSSWVTIISVDKGKIVEREFYFSVWNAIPRPENGWHQLSVKQLAEASGMTVQEFESQFGKTMLERLEWKEPLESLGTNNDSGASDLYTMDDIYAMARSKWLKNRTGAKVYFEAENEGLISKAGYVIDGCADDCFEGVNIGAIESLDNF